MKIYIVVEQYFDQCNFWDTEIEYYQSEDQAHFRVLELEEGYRARKVKDYAAFVKEEDLISES